MSRNEAEPRKKICQLGRVEEIERQEARETIRNAVWVQKAADILEGLESRARHANTMSSTGRNTSSR